MIDLDSFVSAFAAREDDSIDVRARALWWSENTAAIRTFLLHQPLLRNYSSQDREDIIQTVFVDAITAFDTSVGADGKIRGTSVPQWFIFRVKDACRGLYESGATLGGLSSTPVRTHTLVSTAKKRFAEDFGRAHSSVEELVAHHNGLMLARRKDARKQAVLLTVEKVREAELGLGVTSLGSDTDTLVSAEIRSDEDVALGALPDLLPRAHLLSLLQAALRHAETVSVCPRYVGATLRTIIAAHEQQRSIGLSEAVARCGAPRSARAAVQKLVMESILAALAAQRTQQ